MPVAVPTMVSLTMPPMGPARSQATSIKSRDDPTNRRDPEVAPVASEKMTQHVFARRG